MNPRGIAANVCSAFCSPMRSLILCQGGDYCYLPTSPDMDPSIIRSGPNACSPTSKCELCEGDCNIDADCQEGLQCFHRRKKQAVPGCRGGEYDRSCTYCTVLMDNCLLVSSIIYSFICFAFRSARLLCRCIASSFQAR